MNNKWLWVIVMGTKVTIMRRRFCPDCDEEPGFYLSECKCFIYEGICGHCGYNKLSEPKVECSECGMKTNQEIKIYDDSNFLNSFKEDFDRIPIRRIMNILEGIDVDDEFYTANAKFIQKLIIELPRSRSGSKKQSV